MKQLHDDFYYRDAYASKERTKITRQMISFRKGCKDSIIKFSFNGEPFIDYPTKRNKRIAIRRALYTLGVLIAVWGMVWLTLSK